MANEAAEVRKQLVHEREQKEDSLAEPALDAAFDSVIEAVLRSVAAKAELVAMQEVRTGQGFQTQNLENEEVEPMLYLQSVVAKVYRLSEVASIWCIRFSVPPCAC